MAGSRVKSDNKSSITFLIDELQMAADGLAPGEVRLHKGEEIIIKKREVDVSLESLKSDALVAIGKVMDVFSGGVVALEREFTVDEIAVQLGVSAKGKIIFVAEASAQAMIQIKLKRVVR